ncbi:trafficking protein particle complex subunit 4 [Culicoides brevitarsis]|uniref:trafficking protein particle complex subunit 4 n=1 Tax=Culicoides brevitarsis TaxID=469753 RepID=UPI00307B6630
MIYGVYIVSKSGGLIFNIDHHVAKVESEKQFSFPLDIKLDYEDNKKVSVSFGQREGINVGNVLTAVNNVPTNGTLLEDGRSIKDFLNNEENFPVTLKFSRPKMTTNERIYLASMFYPLFAIASQLSPEPKSSGIELLEADTFKMNCFQTLTGVKFIIVTKTFQIGIDLLLRKIYELYSDYVLKNPFYALEMPIRCELFEKNLKEILDQVEKTGIVNI